MLMKLFHKLQCIHILLWLPNIMHLSVAFPFDQILTLLPPPKQPHVQYLLHFILLMIFNKVRGWFSEIDSVFFHLLV